MATPLSKYVAIKDKYCICYFGDDIKEVNRILKARDLIEQQLPGLQVCIVCKDNMNGFIRGKKNVVTESKMANLRGKVGYSRNLEEKEDIISLLVESNISFPDDF